ncbi:uncharacterized protein LOC142227275 isoform X2 [Haematobia irritans]|uniref:uncharacterized protein LOC142227275 isoform X2 n=1 Tax=Haematobia irritans TaxID=7368 RepID=UPI003F5077CF
MELPSMVQKSGDTLIVRSVVSGNQLYTDQNSTGPETTNMNTSVNHSNNSGNSNNNGNGSGLMSSGATVTISNSLIMEQFERLKRTQEAAAQHLMQQQELHNHMQQQQQQQQQQNAAMELKEEGLPQCKIKRNYSCSYCTYFTQNPRYHLTHLRDVHGEKIVINKCKLCLYASRHYQKLVRHMKMVHGCTEGVTSGHGQARGKRGMNRDRKRKLEDILAAPTAIKLMNVEAFNAEQIQADLEQKLHRDLDLFKQQQAQHQHQGDQQQHQQKSQQQLSVSAAGAFFAAAYEQQLRAQRELADKDSLKTSHSNYERQVSSPPATTASAITADEVDSPAQQKAYDYTPSSQEGDEPKIQIPPQRPSFELTPSPSGSNSSPPPPGQSTSGNTTPLSVLMPSDEPSNNRLMKCSLCDFTTLYRNNLLEHETEDHCNAKFYRCEKCSYVTHIKARFSKHVKYHSMPMIKCVTCDFRTPYKWNLDRHMKNHGGAGPFRCAACDFTADIKQSLTVHEMNHHVPPVGHAAGMTLARRRNKVGGTDISEDFFSDSAEMLEDHFNNNNMDEYDEMLMTAGPVEAAVYESKRLRYEGDEPTDLSQKGGSSDTSSVHNHTLPKAKKPLPNLIPISKEGDNILNLTTDLATSRSSLSEIASMFFNEKQLSEMLQPMDKSDAVARAVSQLSPTTTINSSSASSKSLLSRKTGSFFDKIKSSSTTNENLICPCGHMAKCLSESIIHRKSCTFLPLSGADDIDLDDEDHDEDGEEGRLEIDFNDDEDCDKQSHSALNLSVTGSTRCQHCRHRCKSSADLLNHLKICSEANSRCGDSVSGESFNGSRSVMGTGSGADNDATSGDNHHPMENRVFVWNKLPRNQQPEGSQNFDAGRQHMHQNQMNSSSTTGGSSLLSSNNDENSYYGVETAPGYGEMTPEEEAANSSLKKVYKCPHCSFWASTASRFHVHIVGHLNKKPFECSLCSYRSNWRWDITKHIRLKTIRDPSHKNARVLMNDETGRRNYTKYNKYITLMKVTEEDGDPKLMKSGEMTPNQVASLAFINDYNSKQQQQGSASSSGSTPIANILNGVREDITLEPIGTPKTVPTSGGDEGISDNFIRLPLLASMMNAAMAQQQHQKSHIGNGHETATLITPSVTISAVKKPSHATPTFKSSDEIILEVRPDSNEKIYKCRKCNFRHMNRDAVLAHVKVHFPEPIVTATPSPKAAHSSPLQVSVNNSNLYMNKVLAAMCLTQQQPANSANAQLSSLVAAGLLDQASGNSPLSGLALALAGGGKSPLKASQLNAAAANIIEHGEQKAILNDQASAENTMTSSSSHNQLTLVKALQHNPHQHQMHQQQQIQATSASSLSGGYGASSSSSATSTPKHSSSLQSLLTSPRGASYAQMAIDGGCAEEGGTMVMGSPKTTTTNPTSSTHTNKTELMAATPKATTIVTTTTSTPSRPSSTLTQIQTPPPQSPLLLPPPPTHPAAVTFSSGLGKTFGDGYISLSEDETVSGAGGGSMCSGSVGGGGSGMHSGVGLQDLLVVMGATTTTTIPTTISSDHQQSKLSLAASTSCSASLLSSSLSNPNQNQNQNTSSSSPSSSVQNHSSNPTPSTSASNNSNNLGYISGNGSNSINSGNNNGGNAGGNGGNNNNNNNLLTHDTTSGDRRDPSPYRCGHCHQVSNWKHVIQRHCRLKHAGVINIETLDRAATGDRHTAPIYKPLVNGALSEQTQAIANNNSNSNASNSQYNLTLKALQHQQQQSNSNNNNNNVLIDNNHQQAKLSIALPKTEPGHSLLHSPLAIPATASGPSQDLQAAAVAYLAAAYKAAAAQNNNNPNAATAATIATITSMAEELLLQQQLQKNDQIEITRVSSSSTSGATGTNSQNHQHMNLLNQSHQTTTSVNNSNLAQLLESTSNNANNSGGPSVSNQSNSKSKQQKCPLCPYICDSKSQMNYHISLHKPTQYECHLCTFVCAKKQHLSSHMRTVHQMLPAAQQHQHQVLTGTNSGLNMDFSLALKMAAAAKSQQDSPLAIDLSGMKQNLSSMASPAQRSNTVAASTSNQLQTQQLPPEYQYRLIYYCNKCPARYAQKHNDPLTAKSDLDEHLRQHEPLASSSEDNRKYQCEYCDYRAAHETLIQAHRFVHSSQYQEKCNELYKNCKDDTIFRAPKLMHITATRKQHQHQQHHETIWVVDQDLNEGHPMIKMGGQNSAITSSSQHNAFQVGNSLLKKQLEAKQSPPGPGAIAGGQEELTNKRNSNEDDSNPTDSTMASGLSSELDADHHLDKANEEPVENGAEADGDASVEPKERCQHCPFESSNTAEFKTHIQQHIAVSQQRLAYTCEHCDYTAEEQDQIDEHTRVHFNSMEKLKEVAFFTRYDKLELSMEQRADEDAQKDDDQTQEGESMHIKKEVQSNNNNNNNDEDRINENFKQTSNGPSEDINGDKQSIPSPPPPKCAKIILYKNDGCLTIKKEAQEAQTQQASNTTTSASSSPTNNPTNNSQNISDRLRRRISRQGGASAATAASSTAGQNSNPDDQQSTSHKTILVNAKTGQVISRN